MNRRKGLTEEDKRILISCVPRVIAIVAAVAYYTLHFREVYAPEDPLGSVLWDFLINLTPYLWISRNSQS